MIVTAQTDLIDLPVLKAQNKIFELVECVGSNPYNRDKLRDAIVALYNGKAEKSVFRGMAIPTLRRLGLIIGFGELIRLSANGKLIFEALKLSRQHAKRALGTIVYEIDTLEIGFIDKLSNKQNWPHAKLIDFFIPKVNAPNPRSARERIKDWVGLLGYCDLFIARNDEILLDRKMIQQIAGDADYKKKSRPFKNLLIPAYNQLVKRTRGMQSHPIEDLRAEMAMKMLIQHKQILTEKQFDELLVQFPKTTSDYLISFGRSMGADEKLFLLNGKYFQTISIRFFHQ